MPDIEEGDGRREGEPLERVAVVLLHVDRGRRPVTLEPVGRETLARPAAAPKAAAGRAPSRERMKRGRDSAGSARWRRRRTRTAATAPGRRCLRPRRCPRAWRFAAATRGRRNRAAPSRAGRARPPEPGASASGVTTKKPTLPSICRLSRKTVRSTSQRPRRLTRRWCWRLGGERRSRQRRRVEHGLARARLEARLQGDLLMRAIELPEAEPGGEGDAGERREQRQRGADVGARRRRGGGAQIGRHKGPVVVTSTTADHNRRRWAS